MRRRSKSRRLLWDPVKNWDGLVDLGPRLGLRTSEEVHAAAKGWLQYRENSVVCTMDNEEARRTPIGGMQFFLNKGHG